MMMHCLVEPFYTATVVWQLVEVQSTDVSPFAGTIEERCCIHGCHWESAWPDANALNKLHGITPMV